MTRIIRLVIAVMIVTAGTSGWAGEAGQEGFQKMMEGSAPAERARAQTEMMADTLDLGGEQQDRLLAVNLNYAEKTEAVISSGDGRFQKLRKFRALQKDKDKEVKGILTEAQYDRWTEIRKEKKAELKKMRETAP